MTNPNNVVEWHKRHYSDKVADLLAPDTLAKAQSRIIIAQDEREAEHKKKIAELQSKLYDHDWDAAAEITDISNTLIKRLRSRNTPEQVAVLVTLASELGFADVFKTLTREVKRARVTGEKT